MERPILGFPMNNIFADIPAALPEELVESLKARPNVRIERIVAHGRASPPGFWYDQGAVRFMRRFLTEAGVTPYGIPRVCWQS